VFDRKLTDIPKRQTRRVMNRALIMLPQFGNGLVDDEDVLSDARLDRRMKGRCAEVGI
jgi:hypothetical protein